LVTVCCALAKRISLEISDAQTVRSGEKRSAATSELDDSFHNSAFHMFLMLLSTFSVRFIYSSWIWFGLAIVVDGLLQRVRWATDGWCHTTTPGCGVTPCATREQHGRDCLFTGFSYSWIGLPVRRSFVSPGLLSRGCFLTEQAGDANELSAVFNQRCGMVKIFSIWFAQTM
jgi:hypothetical protein